MSKSKKALTAQMQAAIHEIQVKYAAYEQRKDAERPRAWELVMQEIERRAEAEKRELVTALNLALALGVPKSAIQKTDILGSTDQSKINKILGAPPKRAKRGTIPMFTWLDEDSARIVIPKFDTRSAASDYPEQLSGVVQRDAFGWSVLIDDSDEGDLPGHLRWELEQDMHDKHLGRLLDGLAEKAKR